MNASTIVRLIAAQARTKLGRPAKKSKMIDWEAANAIEAAAKDHLRGCESLLGWARPGTLTDMATYYVLRHAQAYGPVGDLIIDQGQATTATRVGV